MNYTLNLQLEGADKASAALDDLMKKVGSLGAGGSQKISFNDWLSHDPMKDGVSMGEEIGEGIKKGAKKNLKGNWLGLSGEFGSAIKFASANIGKMWEDALKVGKTYSETGTINEAGSKMKGYGIADIPKIFSKQDWALPNVEFPKLQHEGKKENPFEGYKNYGMADVAKGKFAVPQTPAWMNTDFFKKQSDIPKMDWKKMLVGLGLGATNPYVGSRLLSDELGKGSGSGVAGGLFGKGGIAGFAEIYAAFKLFKFSVEVFKSTVENASKMYSKALQSGLGLGFTVKRSMLAEIMGVSEADIFKFGSQLAYLNPKLELAASTISKTTQPLTELGWGMKIAEKNISALWSVLINEMSPSINALVDDFNSFLEVLGKSDSVSALGTVFNFAFVAISDFIGVFEVAINLISVAFTDLMWVVYKSITETFNDILKIPGVKKLTGLKSIDNSEIDKKVLGMNSALIDEAQKVWDNGLGKTAKNVPSPQSWMKQIPASSWEKMGLVMGGGSNNYAKDTAKNTKEIASGIKAIVANMRSKPSGGQWGMSPNVSQP